MKQALIIAFLFLLASCKSEADKLIDDYASKVETYEELVTEGIDKNKTEINDLGDDISAIMDALGTQELSAEQQSEVTGISLQFQVALMMLQQDMTKTMDAAIDSILNGLDSVDIEMLEMDSM